MRRALRLAPFFLAATVAAQVPSPEAHLGFRPGTDSVLADWSQINRYLSALANASPVVRLDTIGRTHLNKPLLMVTFASEPNMGRLAELRAAQARLADPRVMDAAEIDRLVRSSPAVVLINNNIHSTEIASSQMQLEMAHKFATDPMWRGWLDSTVVLMIPSTNPDGLDTTIAWYRQHKGTRYESGPMPWLYHPYVGHDNNRDWYMLTQPETRDISRVIYEEWFPAVVWDIHQMGNNGARLFIPPFADPVNPNLDPILVAATNLVGTAMAGAVLDAGLTGVSHQRQFDLWWHGGFRTAPARHNMIGILSEMASARLASPIQQDPANLRQPERGINYPAPWPGGWWRMRDIVDYELYLTEGLMRLVATQREQFVRRFVTLGARAIADTTGPSALLIPAAQRDPEAWYTLADLLIRTGADIRQRPNGDLVIPMNQPFRIHVKDLLERQVYPDNRQPYDVAGWSLGMQMG
ncbi:MAG: M14 metallopeptidase family protein, partial [Gemmatimonadales bacterium]